MRSSLLTKIKSKIRIPPHTPPPENGSARQARSETFLGDSRTSSLSYSATAQKSLSSLQEQLWNQAYDELKASEPKVVDVYETILLKELCPSNTAQNDLDQTTDTRHQQMQKSVQAGLERTLRAGHIKEIMGDGLGILHTLKGVVDKAIQTAPQAAVVWVGVCIGLEIISKPITEARSNRKGIIYVVSRMNWYWNLAHLLLDENRAVGSSAGLRNELESRIVELYQKVLLYQIRSVCLYYRNQLIVIGRDLLSLDDWAGQLSSIREAEDIINKDAEQYNTEQIKDYISNLATTAVSQEKMLDGIHSAIRDQTQRQEERYQDNKDNECLKDLYETNPSKDKERILDTKGGLLRDSYIWVLENSDFKQFYNNPQQRLLCIKGDPGKGKTMLLCGIINELQNQPNIVLSYFFCQATEAQLNNATSVLRGLMYLLLEKRPSLISHLRARYDTTGEKLFQGISVWESLAEILMDMLTDPTLTDAVFVVDALDECTTNRSRLLDFIVKLSSTSSSAKWIISCRNWPEIEEQLNTTKQKIGLQLELNQESISEAVAWYIDRKVDYLCRLKNYDEETGHAVRRHLTENANGTFLWVALVCQELASPRVKKRHTLDKLKAFPPGLQSLYSEMIKYINNSEDAVLCKQLLAVSTTAYRPLTIQEMKVATKGLEGCDQDELREITRSCGSFLTLREDIVYFVHQSAKEYLNNEAFDDIFPSGVCNLHHATFRRSLNALSQTLKRDIYDLGSPGILVNQVLSPKSDLLEPLRYSAIHWVDHLKDSKSTATDTNSAEEEGKIIYDFIQQKYLYWLEALSLLGCISEGVTAVQKLEDFARSRKLQPLAELLQDARQFLLSHKSTIQVAPLQLYASALLFSPASSLIRGQFKKEEPDWVRFKTVPRTNWGRCLHTLEGHNNGVNSVAFSHDSKLVASASEDKIIRIWCTKTGECKQAFKGHSDSVYSVAFSHDSTLIASASEDEIIRIWCTNTGECKQALKGHNNSVHSVAFSYDSTLIVSASFERIIRIWRIETGKCTQTLRGHSDSVSSVAFSHDSVFIVSASHDKTIRIWRIETGECIQTLKGHGSEVSAATFSHDSKFVVSASYDRIIRIWCTETGECTQTLEGHDCWVFSAVFSHDSTLIASAASDGTIRIWRTETSECIQTLKGHVSSVESVVFSHDSTLVASASDDRTIRIWRIETDDNTQTRTGHSRPVNSVVFSHDSTLIASASDDKTIRIWRVEKGACIKKLKGHSDSVKSVAFSHDSTLVASAAINGTIRIWRIKTGQCLKSLKGHYESVNSVAFSHDSMLLASASDDMTIRIWRTETGQCTQILYDHTAVYSVTFSHDSMLIASASYDGIVLIWRTETGECIQALKGHTDISDSVAFSHDSQLIVSASHDQTIRIWRTETGECKQAVYIRGVGKILSFEADRKLILTDNGAFSILNMPSVRMSTISQGPHDSLLTHCTGYGISPDNRWVTSNGENALWLPMEFRPICSAVSESTVALGCHSGRVIVLELSYRGTVVDAAIKI